MGATPTCTQREAHVLYNRQATLLLVCVVRAGEPLMDGPNNPHDILRVKGEKTSAR